MNNYMLSNSDLSILKKSLPHGAQKEIAKKLKVSSNLVTSVLNGRTYSVRVIDEALKHYKRVVEKQKEQYSLFQELKQTAS